MVKKTFLAAIVLLILVSCQSVPGLSKDPLLDLIPADGILYLTINPSEWKGINDTYRLLPLVFSDISGRQLEMLEKIDYCIACVSRLDRLDISLLIKGSFPPLADFIAAEPNQTWSQNAETWYNPKSSIYLSEPAPGAYLIRTCVDDGNTPASREQQKKFGRLLAIMHKSSISFSINDMTSLTSFMPADEKLPLLGLIVGLTFDGVNYRMKITFMYEDKNRAKTQLENCKSYISTFLSMLLSQEDADLVKKESSWESDTYGNNTWIANVPMELLSQAVKAYKIPGFTQ